MRIPFFSRSDWQDPDWRVREQAAFQMRDQEKLLFLALQDVSEEVRVAASKSLRDDKYRLNVVLNGYCEHARRLAAGAIRDPAALRSILHNPSLPLELRLVVTQHVKLEPSEYVAIVADESEIDLRLWAVARIQKSDALNALYAFSLPESLRLALIPKLTDKALLAQIVAHETDPALQKLALAEITDEPQLAALFARLEDAALRRLIVDRVHTPALLEEMLEDVDEEALRLHLVGNLRDPTLLRRIALNDRLPRVRMAALKSVPDPALCIEVASRDPDRRVRLTALDAVTDDTALSRIVLNSDDEQLRWRAVERIQRQAVLSDLEKASPHPDVRWQVGRKLSHAPLDDLFAISSPWTLRQIAESEKVSVLQQMAVRLITPRHVIEELASLRNGVVTETAQQILHVTVGSGGIPFVPIAERPYQLGLFPLTRGQTQALLGADPRWEGEADLPATGLSLAEVEKICLLLQKEDGAVYRLPSFEEWQHAIVAGDKRWTVPSANRAAEPWVDARLNLHASGPRPLHRAWPNPWGLLDAIGNVSTWVDEDPGPTSWINHSHERDPLSAGAAAPEIRHEDYAVAAGPHWADVQLKPSRWERLVRLANLNEFARDKVGVRLLRATRKTVARPMEYRLVLESEPRWALSRENVTAALARSTVYSYGELEKFYRVAPIVVLVSSDYEFVRKLQSVFRRCGAEASIVSKALDSP